MCCIRGLVNIVLHFKRMCKWEMTNTKGKYTYNNCISTNIHIELKSNIFHICTKSNFNKIYRLVSYICIYKQNISIELFGDE